MIQNSITLLRESIQSSSSAFSPTFTSRLNVNLQSKPALRTINQLASSSPVQLTKLEPIRLLLSRSSKAYPSVINSVVPQPVYHLMVELN